MMYQGVLGKFPFSVTEIEICTFRDLTRNREYSYAEHKVVSGLPKLQHTGRNLDTVELTEFLTDGPSVLTVAVRDGTDTNEYCRGKQKTKRGGIWYTPQSGIWQTVWAEHVPENYVQALLFTPELPEGRVRWRLAAPAPKGARIEISYQGTPVAEGETDEDGRLARMEAFTLKAVENLVNLSHR